MKYLRRLFVRIWSDSAGSKTDVIKKIHVLCPSLRVIHIQIRLQVQQSVYDWEERSKSWILSPSYRDIWAEAIHEIDVCVYRLLKVISVANTSETAPRFHHNMLHVYDQQV
jgi:hypothetical protein